MSSRVGMRGRSGGKQGGDKPVERLAVARDSSVELYLAASRGLGARSWEPRSSLGVEDVQTLDVQAKTDEVMRS